MGRRNAEGLSDFWCRIFGRIFRRIFGVGFLIGFLVGFVGPEFFRYNSCGFLEGFRREFWWIFEKHFDDFSYSFGWFSRDFSKVFRVFF